jgi:hypothetical protein
MLSRIAIFSVEESVDTAPDDLREECGREVWTGRRTTSG